MFTYLGGSPDTGGSWIGPNGNPHSGVFDPLMDTPGCYTSTVEGITPCVNDAAVLCVFVNQAPDPGADTTIMVCDSDPPFLMFDTLGGMPQSGGMWTFNGAPHSPVFVPGVDSAGCYQYSITGTAPCTDSSATLCVIDSCLNVCVDALRSASTGMWISGGWNTDHPVVTIVCEGSALLELIDASGRTLSRQALRTSSQNPRTIRPDLSAHGRGLYTLVLHHSASSSLLRLLNE